MIKRRYWLLRHRLGTCRCAALTATGSSWPINSDGCVLATALDAHAATTA